MSLYAKLCFVLTVGTCTRGDGNCATYVGTIFVYVHVKTRFILPTALHSMSLISCPDPLITFHIAGYSYDITSMHAGVDGNMFSGVEMGLGVWAWNVALNALPDLADKRISILGLYQWQFYAILGRALMPQKR